MPLPEDFNAVALEHCNALLGEAEGPHLEFKRDLPRPDNAGRHEFLADVSAFANSTGGDLVYGIDEDGEALASALIPSSGNADEEVRRLQDTILNGLEPRAPGVQVKAVAAGDRFLVVVRVPQSWAGPHRVKTNQHFYVREGARKRQLDMPEIRSMFLRTEAQVQRVRDFRTERIGRLLAGDAPVRLVPGSIEVLHLIPTQAALGLLSPDPVQYMRQRALPGLAVTGLNMRINIDGALGVRTVQAQGSHGYSLFFRNGFFEATKVLTAREDGMTVLASLAYEQEMIALLDVFRAELRRLGAGEEVTAMLTLVRASRMDLGVDRARFDVLGDEGRFDREVVAVPDVLLPADQPSAAALRPLFDLVWQAAGFERSFNFDPAGNWLGRR